MKIINDLEPFRSLLEREQNTGYVETHGNEHPTIREDTCTITIKLGRKFACVDIGKSNRGGRYMVDRSTGEIFGIKAYGVVHRGHRFGTLDTISEWDWRGYRARPIMQTASNFVHV